MMNKIIVTLVFLCVLAVSAFGQTLPSRIDGGIPPADSPDLYQIQVGAFRLERNRANTTNRLRGGGFNPIFEDFGDLTRVIISQVPANEIVSNLERIALLGFDHVIIRKETNDISLSFSPVNEPSEAPMPKDIETDLFTRAWKIIHRTGSGLSRDGMEITETVGRIYLYSTNGTYMVTSDDDSVVYISHWRWVDGSREEFEYSHDNWQTYEKSKIVTLNENSLIITEYYTTGAIVEFIPAYIEQ